MDNWRRYPERGRRELGSSAPLPTVAPRVSRYVVMPPSSVVPVDYVRLLGSNLVALWHQSQGVTISSGTSISQWSDVVSSRAMSLVGTGTSPQYAADSTYFGAKPVVKFAANAKCLATATATIIAAGARPYVFCVSRWRDGVGDYPYVWQLNDTQDMVHFTAGTAGNQLLQFKQPGIQYADAGAHNTLPHLDEAWLDGTYGHFMRDGTDHTVAATGSIGPVVDRIQMGGSNNFGSLSIYLWGVCTAAPDAGTRAILNELLSADMTDNLISPYIVMPPGSANAGGRIVLP